MMKLRFEFGGGIFELMPLIKTDDYQKYTVRVYLPAIRMKHPPTVVLGKKEIREIAKVCLNNVLKEIEKEE